MPTKEEITNRLYAIYGTDSGIIFGIKERSIVEAIVNFVLNQVTSQLCIEPSNFPTMTKEQATAKAKQIIETWEHATNHAPTGEWSADIFLASSEGSRLVWELGEGWVSVKDRLPEIGEWVLVNHGRDTVLKGRLMNNGWAAFFMDGEFPTDSITYWQPLPEPPKIN